MDLQQLWLKRGRGAGAPREALRKLCFGAVSIRDFRFLLLFFRWIWAALVPIASSHGAEESSIRVRELGIADAEDVFCVLILLHLARCCEERSLNQGFGLAEKLPQIVPHTHIVIEKHDALIPFQAGELGYVEAQKV